MSATHVVVEGTLKPDGSLELDSNMTVCLDANTMIYLLVHRPKC